MMQSRSPKLYESNRRRGVTLTEVLMSLMIMSIGAVSVMTLFPIAALRSAEATRLTNSAILKYNIESVLETRPFLIFDPDNDGNIVEHFQTVGARNYIVDPVGYATIAETSTAAAATFGDSNGELPRFDGGITGLAGGNARALRVAAWELAGLGDSWETTLDFVPGTTTGITSSIAIPVDVLAPNDRALLATSANTRPSVAGFSDPEWSRIVLFAADGTFSTSFPLLALDASTGVATWSETVAGADYNGDGYTEPRTLPREFGGVVSRVMIQTRRSVDYSWLLTVRRTADGRVRSLDVVVRHGGSLKVADEMSYPVTAGSTTNVTEFLLDGTGGSPALRKGGYVFDVGTARWHRVIKYEETSTDIYAVTLERPAASFSGPMIVLPGVVDVFGMGSRSIPDVLQRGF